MRAQKQPAATAMGIMAVHTLAFDHGDVSLQFHRLQVARETDLFLWSGEIDDCEVLARQSNVTDVARKRHGGVDRPAASLVGMAGHASGTVGNHSRMFDGGNLYGE
jgi:hypothetical protein